MKKPLEKVNLSNVKKVTGLHFTTKHTAKMAGLASISTTCKSNPYCIARIEKARKEIAEKGHTDIICASCFSDSQQNCFNCMVSPLEKNAEILTSSILDFELLPIIDHNKYSLFRFEAFGDLINETQVINYFNIAKKNPLVCFALWTKNPEIVKRAIKAGNGKPSNLVIVGSSLHINKQEDFSNYDFIDKVFTVYRKEYAESNNINVNCGARSCASCQRCYHNNGENVINEILK